MTLRSEYLSARVKANKDAIDLRGQLYGLSPYGIILSDQIKRSDGYLSKSTTDMCAALMTTTNEFGFDEFGVSHCTMFSFLNRLHYVDTTVTIAYAKILEVMIHLLITKTRNPDAPKEYWLSIADDFLELRLQELATSLVTEFETMIAPKLQLLAGNITNNTLEFVAAFLLKVSKRPHRLLELEDIVAKAGKYNNELHDNPIDREWYTSLWIELAIRGYDSINNYAELASGI